MMAEDWDDCANNDVDMRETKYKAKLSSRITNAMFTLHALTIIAYSAGILLADVDFTDPQAELPLLLKVNLPVDINTKRTYRMLLSAQFVHLIMSGCGTGLLNSLLLALVSRDDGGARWSWVIRNSKKYTSDVVAAASVIAFFVLFLRSFCSSLSVRESFSSSNQFNGDWPELLFQTLHVGGQMDVLRCWLNELVPERSVGRRESIVNMTNKIIRKHQRIINFSEYIEDLYTYIALVQFTSNTVLICSLGFLIVTVSHHVIANRNR